MATSAEREHLSKLLVVLFYGHGEPDRLIGQRGRFSTGSGPTLIDTSSVGLLVGRPVYAVCCHARAGLGPAYGGTFPSGAFVGYESALGFSRHQPGEFMAVVNRAARDFVGGTPARAVVTSLQNEWRALSDAFLNPSGGRLFRTPDFIFAGFAAAGNASFVGTNP